MAAVSATLFDLIKTKIDANMKAAGGYGGPLSQGNPAYYLEFCNAIATGIADGSKVISFTSADTGTGGAPPTPGVGTGVGVIVDKDWFNENMYTEIRAKISATFGKTTHDPWPANSGNGKYLKAITTGISDSVAEHFKIAYNLVGAHPLVYLGVAKVNQGMYSGLDPSNIGGLIISAAPSMKGQFWPIMAQTIAKVYVDAIHMHSTGTLAIAGICVPGKAQVCGIPMVGVGAGTAV